MHIKQYFGKELKARVHKKDTPHKIGEWAYKFYMDYIKDIDINFRECLITLSTMADGPEFAFSYEELEKIADDLIAGKEVKL